MNVQLSNQGMTATQSNSYNTNIVLIEPLIEGKRRLRDKRSIILKIGKCLSWLSIGVIYADIIRKNNFQLNTSNIDHGAYLASYQGYCFHSDDAELNSQMQSFTFKQEDEIKITVNGKK
jgi:hypothetical protein